MNLTPLKSRVLRSITRSKAHLRDVSEKSWNLHDAETYTSPRAIFLDGDTDKITAFIPDTTPELEKERMLGGVREHAATIVHQVTHVEYVNGSLYKNSVRHRLLPGPEKLIGRGTPEHIAQGAMACSLYGSTFFAHWIGDDMTAALALEGMGTPVTPRRKPYHHEPGYTKILGIKRHEITRAHFDKFVWLDDFGQNSFKRKRYATIMHRLRAAAPGTTNERVFIRRGSSGAARSLINAAEVEACLVSQGFAIVEPEHLTAEEIVRQTSGASIVMGVEGSQMVHGMFNMSPTGTVCILQPPFRFTNLHKDFTDCMGMPYGFLTGVAAEGGFTISIEELKRFLQKVEAAA